MDVFIAGKRPNNPPPSLSLSVSLGALLLLNALRFMVDRNKLIMIAFKKKKKNTRTIDFKMDGREGGEEINVCILYTLSGSFFIYLFLRKGGGREGQGLSPLPASKRQNVLIFCR